MSKKVRQGRRKRKNTMRAAQTKRRSRLAKVLSAAIVNVGALAAVLTLFPRLSISNTGSIDSGDPFSTPFLVANDGYVPLSSVEFSIYVRTLKTTQGDMPLKGDTFILDNIQTLWPGDGLSLYAGRAVRAPNAVEAADIDILITYHPCLAAHKQRATV